jgi:hypothetical protein
VKDWSIQAIKSYAEVNKYVWKDQNHDSLPHRVPFIHILEHNSTKILSKNGTFFLYSLGAVGIHLSSSLLGTSLIDRGVEGKSKEIK